MKASNRIVADSLTSQESQIMSLEQRVKKLEESYQLTDLRAQVERLHADGAVMRGGLEDAISALQKSYDSKEYPADGTSEQEKCSVRLRVLIGSTNSGRDLLARYREAVWCLHMLVGIIERNVKSLGEFGWVTEAKKITGPDPQPPRRDTLLATVKGEVES